MNRFIPLAALALVGTACEVGIPNQSTPEVRLLAPTSGAVLPDVPDTEFVIVVTDIGDNLGLITVTVSSDLDGELCRRTPGTSGLVTCEAALSRGLHEITVVAEDPDARRDRVQAIVEVVAAPPPDVDQDEDGFTAAGGDCDDLDSAVHPEAIEVVNGRDDDCDGWIDEDTVVSDDDGDGYTEDDGDCDDADGTVAPGAPERTNGVDDDCDGAVDEPDGTWQGFLALFEEGGTACLGGIEIDVVGGAVPEVVGAGTCDDVDDVVLEGSLGDPWTGTWTATFAAGGVTGTWQAVRDGDEVVFRLDGTVAGVPVSGVGRTTR